VRPVRTYFTGRETQLAKLEAAFRDPTRPTQQRFVIYGLSGSGKTELAFKFADGYRHKFWGVFFVDGSSQKNAFSSYAEIATLGGVEPNEKAAKNWLTTRALPWLLIIDNVDDDEINIDELLPQGTKGCVLITTRNPAHMTYGNVGDRHLELLPMERDEAETLLIKAAEEPRPWPKSVADSASSICHALGFLPLALVQAAKAILNGICEWSEYLAFYDRQIQRIRRTLHGPGRSNSGARKRFEDDNNSMNVFSTYEILYESLESSPKEKYQDAVEMLHVFSYFHFQNIRLDVLISSAINPLREEEQQREDDRQEKELQKKLAKPPRKPWIMFFRELRAFVNGKLATPLPMPGVLKNRDRLGLSALEDEVQVRLRHALGVLIERSLVMRQDRATGRYSMHRLIHKWVRERPEMSTSHQALWCQVSMTTLMSSIRRPPHGDTEGERQARRELLPHIRHVRECQDVIEKRLEENVARARPLWPVKKSYGRLQAEQDVRFSRVYAESGQFDDARQLQERALEFVSGRLGPDHPLAIWLSLFLTKTLWEMSEIDKATQRQRQARQLCVNTWGEDHPLTLDVTDLLGSVLYLKGRWAEASSLHAGNVEKMKRLYGEKHEKTLKSIRNLARLHFRYMDYEKATRLYQIAWEGMRETLGETHLETLISLEDLAMSYLRYEEEDADPHREEQLAQSHENMTFVYEQRKKLLGEEQPYTLLAILYLARLKSAMGQYKKAETMIREGLNVAERNVGKEHIGVLMAKTIYAEVLTKQGKFAEAESIFYMLIDKARYSQLADEDRDHPDRLTNLWLLAQCLEEQGKLGEALEMCHQFLAGLADIGGNGLGMRHKILPRMREKIARLQEKLREDRSKAEVGEGVLVEI
jgi:tetratricopeptide (TPR) repeat protein